MNNAFGLSNRTFLNWGENNVRVDQRVIRGDNRILSGKVTNVRDHHHIAQTYDVELMDFKDASGAPIILRACKRVSNTASFDGVGTYSPLEEGDPVLLLSKNGKLEDSLILGSFFTNGEYDTFLREGQGDQPFKTYEDTILGHKTAAQASIHPSRIAQPDSLVQVVGAKNIATPFDDPRYHRNIQEQRKASPQAASIEIKNKNGDVVQYSSGSQVYYADKELIIITNANGSSRCQSLNESCHFYLCYIEKSMNYLGLKQPTTPIEQSEASSITSIDTSQDEGLRVDLTTSLIPTMDAEDPTTISSPATSNPPIPSSTSSPPLANRDPNGFDYNEWSPSSYHLEQARKLACMYRKAAEDCNKGTMATSAIAAGMRQIQNERSFLDSMVKVEQGEVDPCNYAKKTTSKFKPLFVIHETASSSDSALGHIAAKGSFVSYHGLIKRDGTVVKLVDEKDNAFGADCSSYPSIKDGPESWCDTYSKPLGNEETECIPPDEKTKLQNKGCGPSEGIKCSVNNFSIHYSLESPSPYGDGDTHEGYTREQYISLAYLIEKSSVDLCRVVTHSLVDNSGTRRDPRSLSIEALTQELNRRGVQGNLCIKQSDIVGTPTTPPLPSFSVLPVQCFLQTDNKFEPERTCNTSSCAMAAMFLGGKIQSDDEYYQYVIKHGDTTDHAAQTAALQDIGIQSTWSTSLDFADLDSSLEAGKPVVIGIYHRGPSSSPTGGHMLVVIGRTQTGDYIVNDPYGDLNTNYQGDPNQGCGAVYSRAELQLRWTKEGPGTGWGRLF
jgi:hypothetical protein